MLKINYVGRLFENTFCVELHSHSSWEVVYYNKGTGYIEIGNENIPFEENNIFAIPPNILHTDYAPNGFRNYHYNLIDFDFNRKSFLKLKDSNNKDFLKIVEQLYYEYHLKRNNWQNIVNSLCDVLNQYILSFSEEFTENEFVEKVINQIIHDYYTKYCAEDIHKEAYQDSLRFLTCMAL